MDGIQADRVKAEGALIPRKRCKRRLEERGSRSVPSTGSGSTPMLGVRVVAASPARSSAGGRDCERSSGLCYGLPFMVDFDLIQYPVDGGTDTESLAEKML